MQQVIYVDVLIFLNTIITFILLLTVRRFTGAGTTASRLVVASFIGGCFSLVILAPEMGFWLSLLVKAVIGVSITLLAFRLSGVRLFCRTLALFLGVSFLYAGILWGLSRVGTSTFLTYSNGYLYADLSLTSLIFLSVVIYLLIVILQRTVFREKGDPSEYEIKVSLGGNTVEGKALWDSGNDVRDVYSGREVIILAPEKARELTGVEISTDIPKMGGCGLSVRLLPVKGIDGDKLLPAFTVDKVYIHNEKRSREVQHPCIAVSAGAFAGGKYQALIGRKFFEGREHECA